MSIYNSPLRYPGGKTKLVAYVLETLEINELIGGTYVEPFAGGAGIAWYLLLNDKVKHVCINDINPSIYAFWHCVLHSTEELTQRIIDTPVTIEEWFKQKQVQECGEDSSILDLGFSTFFLNRTNRSGIIKGGVMGGKNQDGKYKLDCRYNKEKLIQQIESISSLSDKVTLTKKDAREFLIEDIKKIEGKCLINIDPPYYLKGKGLYQNFFEHHDHCELCDVIRTLNRPWIVTYDNAPEINEIYRDLKPSSFDLTYTAQVKRKGSEVIIYSPRLNKSPLNPNISLKELKKVKRLQA
ncbi:DNA adenine methylase [Pseudoalteromonas sp. XI10]|uniref:DNA adenine methylase n=1 Tax=Pseudoalteromonas sp. XI10 TaxID=1766621 RepID=UPI000B0D5F13|nr:DNA adenine methylase [Pseudoalteromonas sp. XI10]